MDEPATDEHLDMIELVNPTKEDFTYPWGGTNHTIQAGESKIWQRFLADHMCKHLIDREIQREDATHIDEKTGKAMKANLNNEALREKWRKKIIIGVYQKFAEDAPMTEGEKVAKSSELFNEEQEARIKKLVAHERNRQPVSESGSQGKRKPGRPKGKTGTETPKETTDSK